MKITVHSSCGRPGTKSTHAGFTMVELMVVVAISGILFAVGVPEFSRYMAQRALNNQVSALVSAMRLARNEASNNSSGSDWVTICQSNTANTAAPTCSNTSDWSSGWIVFRDFPPVRTREPTDPVLSVQQAFSNSGGIVSAQNGYTISFMTNGIAAGLLSNSFLFKKGTGSNEVTKKMCVSGQGDTRIC